MPRTRRTDTFAMIAERNDHFPLQVGNFAGLVPYPFELGQDFFASRPLSFFAGRRRRRPGCRINDLAWQHGFVIAQELGLHAQRRYELICCLAPRCLEGGIEHHAIDLSGELICCLDKIARGPFRNDIARSAEMPPPGAWTRNGRNRRKCAFWRQRSC